MDRMANRLNETCIRILQLFYLNILWFVFTLAGLVVLGFGPSTAAMFTVIRQWIRGNKDVPIFKTFWKSYRSDFKTTAIIGFFYLVAGSVLYTDLLYVHSYILRSALFIVGFIYMISICYIFPIIVHYDWKGIALKIKCSVLFGISYLQYTLLLFVTVAVIYFILFHYPGFLFVFGVSIGSYIIMWFTNQVFMKIEIQAGVAMKSDREEVID